MYDMSTTLTVRTGDRLDATLRSLARSQGVNLSELVRSILEDAVDELSLAERASHLGGRLELEPDGIDGWRSQIRERNWRT